MTEPITSLPEAVAAHGALPMPAGSASTVDELQATIALLHRKVDSLKSELKRSDDEYEAVVGERDRALELVAELETLTQQATQFRVEAADGAVLVIRRSLSGTWAAIESEARGRHKAWTKRGWRIAAVLADSDVYCWPDAQTAVTEAQQAMKVRDQEAAS